ncbi:MAG: hypothetical protein JWN73_810 [Betaproteobacteria bacterium]|nr:hypothetical protein [Betaproteobacteria bacterium]
MTAYIIVLSIGLAAGVLSGIVGFGSSIMLMPALIIAFGPREAVPIMAVAAIIGNLSRVMVWWREIDWRVVGAYVVTAAPFSALGARTLLILPPRIVEASLAVFFIAMIPLRHWLAARQFKLKLWHLSVIAAFIGFITGIVVSTGPINVPFFLAYGLVKGAFIGTEAMSSVAVFITKALVFRSFGFLPLSAIGQGLIIGGSLMAGAYIAKGFLLKLDPAKFRRLMDGLLLFSGLTMLWTALT